MLRQQTGRTYEKQRAEESKRENAALVQRAVQYRSPILCCPDGPALF